MTSCLAVLLALSASTSPTEAETVFSKASRSIVVVTIHDSRGRAVASGSGVAIATDQVVTNGHVLEPKQGIGVGLQVRQGKLAWPATSSNYDEDHDLVLLRVPGAELHPASIRPSKSLKVGERVYAIGAPRGLELSISEGLVAALREGTKTPFVQTTAALSAGSSGGGLFDADGRLVGITTSQIQDAQNLNFAVATEWLSGLPTKLHRGPNAYLIFDDNAPAKWLMLGRHALLRKTPKAAARYFRKGIALEPRIAAGHVGLGDAMFATGKDAEALNEYRRALQATLVEPGPFGYLPRDHAAAWIGIGRVEWRSGRKEEARKAFQSATDLSPRAGTWTDVAFAYDELGDLEAALAAHRRATQIDPRAMFSWIGEGEIHLRRGSPDLAIRPFQHAVKSDDWDAVALVWLGRAYTRAKRFDDATASFRAALERDSNDPETWFLLGLALGSANDRVAAIEAFLEVIRRQPDHSEALFFLAVEYISAGKRDMALKIYGKLRDIDPGRALEFERSYLGDVNER